MGKKIGKAVPALANVLRGACLATAVAGAVLLTVTAMKRKKLVPVQDF